LKKAPRISREERARLLAEFESDSVFFESAGNGQRKFELAGVHYEHSPLNRVLQYLGGLLAFCGALTVVLEWRMRKVSAAIKNDLK